MNEGGAGSVPVTNRQFDTTHWSVVRQAGDGHSPQRAEALEKLCRTYWQPLYAFVRRQGHKEADAQDLTQEFFARLLERNDFTAVDPHKGRFRTFLLASLTHFLANQRDYARAAKRGGGRAIVSLDEMQAEASYDLAAAAQLPPDKLFDQRWAVSVLENAMGRLKDEMAAGGKLAQFDELKAYLTEDPGPGAYADAAARLGTSSQTVAVTVHRLRRRYQALARAEVAETVASPLELEQEMRHLFEALGL